MNHTYPPRLKTVLPRLLVLIAAFAGTQSFAQNFDSGTSTSITSSTNFFDTLYVGFENANNDVSIESNATVTATQVVVGHLSTNNTLSVMDGSRLVAGNAPRSASITAPHSTRTICTSAITQTIADRLYFQAVAQQSMWLRTPR